VLIKCGHLYYLRNYLERRKNTRLLAEARSRYPQPDSRDPLVSVQIPTFNRAEILVGRTIPSILNQTYRNLEVVIVGDCCRDDTEERIRSLEDPRIRFFNLPRRGDYPSRDWARWMVAGTEPANRAIEMASGDWFAPLDDDDEFSRDHIEALLDYAISNDLEMVYGKVDMELDDGTWIEKGSYPLAVEEISRMSALYRCGLRFFRYDVDSWKYREPADWNMWRRMKEAGVRIGFLNRVVGRHYAERSQAS
jgi:glycosyltransferase involved in cell wall biosynthesis